MLTDFEGFAFFVRVALGVLLLTAGSAKLRDRNAFEQAVRGYQLLPDRLSRGVAAVLPPIEVALGISLVAGRYTRVIPLVAAGLLLAFSTWVAIALLRGRVVDCGCFSKSAPSKISWSLVLRNLLLAAGCAFVSIVSPLLAIDSFVPSEKPQAYGTVLPGFILSTVIFLAVAIGASVGWLFEREA